MHWCGLCWNILSFALCVLFILLWTTPLCLATTEDILLHLYGNQQRCVYIYVPEYNSTELKNTQIYNHLTEWSFGSIAPNGNIATDKFHSDSSESNEQFDRMCLLFCTWTMRGVLRNTITIRIVSDKIKFTERREKNAHTIQSLSLRLNAKSLCHFQCITRE